MKISLLAFMVILSVITFSQNIPVTFQVDMSAQIFEGNFIIGLSNGIVRGDFQSDAGDLGGNWQGNLFQLTDADSNSIYTGTFQIPQNFSGTTYNFTYVITNPGQNDYWEVTSRQFTLNPPSVINPIVFFNDEWGTIILEVTNTINFTADISSILGVGIGGAFDPAQDSLLVMGLDWDNYGKNVVGNRKMENTDPFNPGIYTTTLTVTSGSAAPNGVGDSTKWKFKAYPDSRFQNLGWETGSDRWHIYEADGSTVTLPTIVPRILPSWTPPPLILTINLNMFGSINRYNGLPIPLSEIEFIGLKSTIPTFGNMLEGCWCSEDTLNGKMVLLTKISESNWRFERLVPMGINSGYYDYKFAVMYSGADTINGGFEPLNNEFVDTLVHTVLLVDGPPIVINNLFGDPNPVGVKSIENLVSSDYQLEQNYPNPFNPTTKIRYSIPEYSSVTLKVFNLLGEEIETLFNGEQPPGVYEAAFDASKLSSGIYFYTLKTEKASFTKKMILIK
jgi:hypothetical protein